MSVCLYQSGMNLHTCMHVCLHAYMEKDIHDYLCMYVGMQTCITVFMYASAHTCVPNFYSHVSVHIFDMTLNKYGYNIVNITHTTNLLHGHIDQHFAYVCQNMTNYNIYLTCYCHIHASNKYASQIPHTCHICKLVVCT